MYCPQPDWPRYPSGIKRGAGSAVALDPQGRVYFLQRGSPPVLCFSRAGDYLGGWGQAQIGLGHGLRVDPAGMVWVTDLDHHQVYQFTPDGDLVVALGRRDAPGDGLDQFNQPTDIAFAPDGAVFVTDGYGNARILKFSASGALLSVWGRPGRYESEFATPHSMCLDAEGRLYVSDRGNTRIQIFDQSGHYLNEWRAEALPYIDGLCSGPEDTIYAVTGRGNEILRLTTTEIVLEAYGGPRSTQADRDHFVEPPAGRFNVAHGIAVDTNGDVYIAEVRARRVQKLVRCSE